MERTNLPHNRGDHPSNGAAARPRSTSIAVVGLGCWFPGASSPVTLWENVLARRGEFRRLPDCRLPISEYHDPDPRVPDKSYGTRAAFIDGFSFDSAAARIPKSTYAATDVVHWLALDVARRAIEDAGYSRGNIPREKTGVLVGNILTGDNARACSLRLRWPYVRKVLQSSLTGLPDAKRDELLKHIERQYKSVFPAMTPDSLAGALANTIAGRICNFFDLHGGGYLVDGACASSLLAVTTAADGLVRGDLDLAIAGGVDISIDPFDLIGFAQVGALTKGDMRVFDRRGDGFLAGEGAGFVVLKRLADAQAAGDHIYAVLQGWGVSSDGKGGMMTPSPRGQALALQRAYDKAGYTAADLDLVEGHGTGTSVGDRTELEAIAVAIREAGGQTPRACGVTSLKSIIGHTKAAAGVGAMIKAIAAVNRRVLPPTNNCEQPNEVFDELAKSLYPIRTGEKVAPERTLRAGVSAMGFGGINTHITVESIGQASPRLSPRLDERALMVSRQSSELMVLGAADVAELRTRLSALRDDAVGMSEGELPDLAHKLAMELPQGAKIRAALLVGSPEELVKTIDIVRAAVSESALESGQPLASAKGDWWVGSGTAAPRLGFMFPGQGSQQPAMARALIERHEWARELVERADRWIAEVGGEPVSRHLTRNLDRASGPDELAAWKLELSATEIAQPALCVTSLLWLKQLKDLGIEPKIVGGHSLGELLALHVAGALSEEQLIKIAALRGRAMAAAADRPGAMVSLACSRAVAEAMIKRVPGYLAVANVNAPRQTAVSGERAAVDALMRLAADEGVVAQALPVSNAFHSKLVEEASRKLAAEQTIPQSVEQLILPVVSGMTGEVLGAPTALRDYLSQQIVAPVDFVSLVQRLAREVSALVEVGPGRVLSGLAQDILGNRGIPCLAVSSVRADRDLNALMGWVFVQGGEVNWAAFYRNRLIRPFVSASKLAFLDSPCERPLPPFTGPSLAGSSLEASALTASSGLSSEQLSEYMRVRGDFLGQVIRADSKLLPALASLPTPVASPVPDAPDGVEPAPAPAADASVEPTAAAAESGILARLEPLMVETAVTLTGYPAETVSGASRLIDDLNLDSLKVRELVVEAVQAAGLAAVIDRAKLEGRPLANATLGELARAIAEACGENVGGSGEEGAARPSAPQAPTWVRNFAIVYEPETRNSNAAAAWAGKQLLVAAEKADSDLVDALAAHFDGLGARVNRVLVEDGNLEGVVAVGEASHVVCVLPRHTPPAASDHPTKLRRSVRRMKTYASLAPQGALGQNVTFTFVQFAGGLGIAGGPDADAESCNAISFARSLKLESGPLHVRVLDFSPSLALDAISEELALELALDAAPFCMTAIDAARTRRVPRERLQTPAAYSDRNLGWTADDVILVTGGGKGITAECALELANETGAQFALVGSTPLTEGATNPELAHTLERFSQAGVKHRYYACDIANAHAVHELVQTIRGELGPITGLVHGAGLNIPRRVEFVSEEQAYGEVAPKLLGIHNLLSELSDTPPKMIASLTSCIGITGMQGNAWYAFSNETLDLVTRQFVAKHPSCQNVSVAFGLWGDAGMGARMGLLKNLSSMGIGAISSSEGSRRFAELVRRDPGVAQVMVTAFLGRLDEWLLAPAPTFKQRFVDNVQEYKAGVSMAARTTLTLERDLYLNDHVYQGSVVFPGVLGLEAMAQATAHVLGEQHPSFLRCDDIVFHRAILVDQKKGAEIEVRATVEEVAAGEPRRVHASVRAAQAGYELECAEATFVLGTPPVGPQEPRVVEEPLGIEPAVDVYGSILFHGPSYQRIDHVYAVDTVSATASVVISEAAALGEGVFAPGEAQTLLLGDPYFRDATWQVGQLSRPREMALPLGMRSLEFFAPAAYDAGRYVTTKLDREGNREYLGDAYLIDRDGRVLERVKGFLVRVMQDRPELPTADMLADKPRRVPTRKEQLVAHSPEDTVRMLSKFAAQAPALWWVRDPNLSDKTGDERKYAEQEYLAQALGHYGELHSLPPQAVEIIWQANGRPELLGADTTSLDASYDGEYFVCSVGEGSQGCDARRVVTRTEEAWMERLGQAHASLVLELLDDVESHHYIATRVESAHEAARSVGYSDDVHLSGPRRDGALVLFDASTPDGGVTIATLRVKLGDDEVEHVCSVVVSRDTEVESSRRDTRLYVDPQAYRVRMTLDGPEKQPVLEQRWVVGFREAGALSNSVLFPHYLFWMGRLREQSTYNVTPQLMEQLSSGDWGMVTNRAEVKVLGDLLAGDVVQARIWASEIVRSSVSMACEFSRVAADGKLEPVAFCEQQITWVRLTGHGTAESSDFPAYMQRLIKLTGPRVPCERGKLYERQRAVPRGKVLYRKQGTAHRSLHAGEYQTTFEDSNLVGNIYFANYFNWQLRCRDMFTYVTAQSYTRGGGARGEWSTLRSSMTYLRDAMPFDKVRVSLGVKTVYEYGVDLEVEFVRLYPDGREEKLAVGEQDLVWARRVDRELAPLPLPTPLRMALLAGSPSTISSEVGASNGAAAE